MIRTVDELQGKYDELSKMVQGYHMRILVCGGTGCIANGSLEVYEKSAYLLAAATDFVKWALLLELNLKAIYM